MSYVLVPSRYDRLPDCHYSELFEEDVPGDKKRTFTLRFLGIAHKSGLASWQEVRDILRLFLYDQVLDKHLVALFARFDPVHPQSKAA
jgi:hypothetical protein